MCNANIYYVYINTPIYSIDLHVNIYINIIYLIYKHKIVLKYIRAWVCIYIYTHNKCTQHTHIYYTFILNAINRD